MARIIYLADYALDDPTDCGCGGEHDPNSPQSDNPADHDYDYEYDEGESLEGAECPPVDIREQ